MNTFKYSFDNKRYHTFNYHLKNKYHHKVGKLCLNANFTCPNRDGTKGFGGCIFCSGSGSGDYAGDPHESLERQYLQQKEMMHKKWPDCKFIAYFQAYTNTYSDVKTLKSYFEPFLEKEDVVGLTIATRPDCLEDDVVEYLAMLNERCDLWVELGLQTIHDKTALLINRGHDYSCFLEGLNKLRKHHIPVCVHLINGLPYETKEMMLETAKTVGQLDIQALKIHMLYVIRNTKMHTLYEQENLSLMSKEEYVQLVVDQLEYIPSHIIIERLTGDGKVDDLIAPLWSIKKVTVLNDIDKEMVRRDTFQGAKIKT